MREIVLDTETTGLDPEQGHRVVEIGCVELLNHVATGRTLHLYIDPERDMPAEAFAVHGLSRDYLSRFPTFAEQAGPFLDFIAADPLVIHNAAFDLKFLNAELARLGFPPLPAGRAVDTVGMARKRYPGAPASLDALCKRFGVDNTGRTLHGALLDSELLAEVYLELKGGRQPDLAVGGTAARDRPGSVGAGGTALRPVRRIARPPRPHAATAEELAAHAKFLEELTDPLWHKANTT